METRRPNYGSFTVKTEMDTRRTKTAKTWKFCGKIAHSGSFLYFFYLSELYLTAQSGVITHRFRAAPPLVI